MGQKMTMAADMIVGAQLAHILLVLMLFILLGRRKIAAVKAGQVDRKKAALDNRQWPEDVLKVSNNIANQFEAPVLFHALVLLAQVQNMATTFVAGLAVFFVLTRYAHAYVHTTSNFVPHRFRLFVIGVLTLLVMTITLIVQWAQGLLA